MVERYQLRYAAGVYWLLDMEQDGMNYQKPIPLNECGAYIWEQLRQGRTVAELTETMCAEYGIDKAEAKKDIEDFLAQLQQYGI